MDTSPKPRTRVRRRRSNTPPAPAGESAPPPDQPSPQPPPQPDHLSPKPHAVYLTTKELAERWKIGTDYLRKMRAWGRGPSYTKAVNGRALYYTNIVLQMEEAARHSADNVPLSATPPVETDG